MDWNVIVSVQPQHFKAARKFLYEYGRTMKTDYMNVLVMQVEDIEEFLEDMHMLYAMQTPTLNAIGRIVPVTHRFTYQSADDFENKARAIVSDWLDELAGKHFYVRMHRRGFKGRLSSQDEERFLDDFILEQLVENGKAPAKVDFSGAQRVIAVETVGQQAGLSLWTREQIDRYPFLKLQ
ncbi:MAG: THUMP domain-containing protein [Granulosicoccaceae bacterium]|jgi:tRNA(Ser,Leu) C12 N-acetylase TAN1